MAGLLCLQVWLKNTIQAPALATSGGGAVSSMGSGGPCCRCTCSHAPLGLLLGHHGANETIACSSPTLCALYAFARARCALGKHAWSGALPPAPPPTSPAHRCLLSPEPSHELFQRGRSRQHVRSCCLFRQWAAAQPGSQLGQGRGH